jgi:hypothetical protein
VKFVPNLASEKATSTLNTVTEAEVQRALNTLMKGRTPFAAAVVAVTRRATRPGVALLHQEVNMKPRRFATVLHWGRWKLFFSFFRT